MRSGSPGDPSALVTARNVDGETRDEGLRCDRLLVQRQPRTISERENTKCSGDELDHLMPSSPLEGCYSAGTQLSVGLYSAMEAATF